MKSRGNQSLSSHIATTFSRKRMPEHAVNFTASFIFAGLGALGHYADNTYLKVIGFGLAAAEFGYGIYDLHKKNKLHKTWARAKYLAHYATHDMWESEHHKENTSNQGLSLNNAR